MKGVNKQYLFLFMLFLCFKFSISSILIKTNEIEVIYHQPLTSDVYLYITQYNVTPTKNLDQNGEQSLKKDFQNIYLLRFYGIMEKTPDSEDLVKITFFPSNSSFWSNPIDNVASLEVNYTNKVHNDIESSKDAKNIERLNEFNPEINSENTDNILLQTKLYRDSTPFHNYLNSRSSSTPLSNTFSVDLSLSNWEVSSTANTLTYSLSLSSPSGSYISFIKSSYQSTPFSKDGTTIKVQDKNDTRPLYIWCDNYSYSQNQMRSLVEISISNETNGWVSLEITFSSFTPPSLSYSIYAYYTLSSPSTTTGTGSDDDDSGDSIALMVIFSVVAGVIVLAIIGAILFLLIKSSRQISSDPNNPEAEFCISNVVDPGDVLYDSSETPTAALTTPSPSVNHHRIENDSSEDSNEEDPESGLKRPLVEKSEIKFESHSYLKQSFPPNHIQSENP